MLLLYHMYLMYNEEVHKQSNELDLFFGDYIVNSYHYNLLQQEIIIVLVLLFVSNFPLERSTPLWPYKEI